MEEIWKDIEGYEGLYQVSNLGRVKSLPKQTNKYKEIIIKPKPGSSGYLAVGLYIHSKRKEKTIHRLVAEAFIPNPNNYPEVNHKDENKLNNCIDNLEWCTHSYNIRYNDLNIKVAKLKNKFYSNTKSYRTKVINLTTGEEFKSMYAIGKKYSKILNVSKHSIIIKLCRLRNKNNENIEYLGYKWRFIKYYED